VTGADEAALLAAARGGDQEAFGRLIGPRRAELRRHCGRMLRSDDDAEDATQETMLRAWRALPRFEGRAPFGAWLHRIATNACLNAIAMRRQRIVPFETESADHSHATGERRVEIVFEPYEDAVAGLEQVGPRTPADDYEEREQAELALAVALEPLPPLQRNVLLLRDVLGYSARETATELATTVAAANSALQRARTTAADALAEPADPTPAPAGREAVVEYLTAIERGDLEGLVGLLADPRPAGERPWTYAAAPAY
jgi:RNA polymerase sigma-70 factor (ECF subfamily)